MAGFGVRARRFEKLLRAVLAERAIELVKAQPVYSLGGWRWHLQVHVRDNQGKVVTYGMEAPTREGVNLFSADAMDAIVRRLARWRVALPRPVIDGAPSSDAPRPE